MKRLYMILFFCMSGWCFVLQHCKKKSRNQMGNVCKSEKSVPTNRTITQLSAPIEPQLSNETIENKPSQPMEVLTTNEDIENQ